MEVITRIVPYKRSDKYFYLYAMGDEHLGSRDCAEDQVLAMRDEIKETHNALVVKMGDQIDAITKNDKRFESKGLAPWVRADNIVESQRKKVSELFKPIAPKIVAYLSGNHEETVHHEYQDDITRNLADDLGVPYAGYVCFINLLFKRVNSSESHLIQTHAWHGAGSAQTEGARLMRLMRLVNDVQAHIYLMGHLHAITVHTPQRLTCINGKVKAVNLAAVITGTFLKTYNQPSPGSTRPPSYGEKAGYKPAMLGCPIIRIRPDTLEFKVIV